VIASVRKLLADVTCGRDSSSSEEEEEEEQVPPDPINKKINPEN